MVSAHDVRGSAGTRSSRLRTLLLLPLATAILSFLILIPNVFPAQVTLEWDPNTESDLAGYKIYYGDSSGDYLGVIDVGNATTYTVANLIPGYTYYFAVTAYDTSGD
jgi:fibronectin type 3 domain-containing protein